MDLQDPNLLNWLTAMGSAELCILDAELATVRDTLRVVCPFLWSRKSGFTVDEMEEFIELSDLIVRKDPALVNWLNTGIAGMQIPAPTNRSWRLDLGTTESTKSALREMFLKETPSCQLITPGAAFTATQTSGELIKTYGYLQLFRGAMNDAMHSFTSEQRTAGAYSYCRGLLESSVDDSRKDVAVLDCIVRLPHDLSYEEFSNLRVSCFGRPAFVFGRWIGREQMNASGIDLDLIPGDRLLMVYAVLVLPDAFRAKQVFMHSHLEEIVWKSKLHINASLPMSQWNDVICSKYNKAWLSLQQCSDPVSLRNWINQLGVALGVQEPSSSSVLGILDGWNDPTVSLPTFLAITCNLLFRFYWQFSPQWLHHCWINLLLMRETNLELYSDEGNRIFLTIQHGSDEAVLYPSQTKGADLTELSRASMRLLAPFNQTTPRDGDDVVSKFTLMTARPDTVHNPLSNLLLVSIGTLDSTLRRALEDSVAAIVELEDRHVRVSNLPEPWQYNLPKAMMAVVSNPNIRHIVAVGAVQNARVSLRYLEIMAKTPSDFESLPSDLESLPSIYIPPDLTARVAKQLIAIEQYSGDPNNISRMMTFARTHTINSYLDDKLTGIRETPCFDAIQSDAIPVLERNESTPIEGSISNVLAIAETVMDVYPIVIRSILRFGELTSVADRAARFYQELLSYRIDVLDPYSQPTPKGFEESALEAHFVDEWISPGGRFYKRMTESFAQPDTGETVDQLTETIRGIVDAVNRESVSRRLIINVYHPVLDQKDVLGLNTIHFSLSRVKDHSSNWFLHCSVVMRTIDVLSGLPYDIYAVCRFARYVARRAEEMLPPTTRLTAQHVMILALNLHLYCDELNLGIARRIAENG